MTDIVEEHGGFVDKYIGDAIVAIFGAPLHDPEHAANAIAAAIACHRRLLEIQDQFALPDGRRLKARIGLNSGQALVGNIGSRRRFNYTVIGDAVNLAARLEGANKAYGTGILIGERSAQLCNGAIVCREVDLVRVVGRETPERIFEPVCRQESVTDAVRDRLAQFAEALVDFREQRFGEAENKFKKMQDEDPVARVYLDRVRVLAVNPPPSGSDGITDLIEK